VSVCTPEHSRILGLTQAAFTCFPVFLLQIIIFCLSLLIQLHIRSATICFILFNNFVPVDMLADMNTTLALLTYQLSYTHFCYYAVLNPFLWFIPFSFQVRPQSNYVSHRYLVLLKLTLLMLVQIQHFILFNYWTGTKLDGFNKIFSRERQRHLAEWLVDRIFEDHFCLRHRKNDSFIYTLSNSLCYIKDQQDATLAVSFTSHCKITLHVSDAFCVHHQEY
jgi:glucan phosphoethanolaminetransferase (alkaline phosphatase superfamily)